MTRRRVAVVVFVAALLAQGWILGGGFLADDWGLVATMTERGRPDVVGGLRQLAQPAPRLEAPLPLSMYPKFWRPLWHASYLVDLAIWGPRPFGFLLTNLLLHASACALLALLSLRLGLSERASIGAGVLFSLHPTHHEAVGWIAARCGLIATAGVLGCVVLGLAARRRPILAVGSSAALLLGLLAKESAIVAVPLLLLCVAVAPLEPGASRRRWSVLAAPAATFGLWLLARKAILRVWTGGYELPAFAPGSADMWSAWLQRLRVLLGPGKEALVAPQINVALSLLLVGIVVVGAVRCVRGNLQPGAGLLVGAGWLALAFVPVWAFAVDPQVQHEARFLYPAAGALALTLAAALDTNRRLLLPGLALLCLSWGALTAVNSEHRRAAWELSAVLVEETREIVWTQPRDTLVFLIGLPDHVGGAYVGRNAVPGMLDPPFEMEALQTRPRGYTRAAGELRRLRADLAALPAEQPRIVLGWAPELGRYRRVDVP